MKLISSTYKLGCFLPKKKNNKNKRTHVPFALNWNKNIIQQRERKKL
jgi:hypothetical protein